MRHKPHLVYDSHEFEYERAGERSTFVKNCVKYVERFLMKRCAFSIMVNDTIADAVQNLHHLKERPLVVRNIPEKWSINQELVSQNRRSFLMNNGLSDDTFICMYHGILTSGRGIGKMIEAISKVSDVILYVLGDGDRDDYHALAEKLNVKDRVFFHDAVDKDDLYRFVGMADVGMVLIEGICKSYFYSLPNKLFENIQAKTPVIGSSFPEISRIINNFNIGLIVNPDNPDDIAEAIKIMRSDKVKYNTYKANIEVAKEELCWENESEVLRKAYLKIK
jgi:glycosyltransferase involved in cell wall biosynthesis